MSAIALLVGVVLPPITLVIFLAAMANRFITWRRRPQPGMTLFPVSPAGTAAGVIKETLLFPSLFRGNRSLWIVSWLFHATLALIVVGHIRVFVDFPALWTALHIDADTMSGVVGGAAGLTILLMAALLLARRWTLSKVREISSPADHFALLLILAIVVTGNMMRFVGHFDLELTRQYFASLILMSSPRVPMNGWFLAHFFLAQALFIYIPFSKILHFGGVFFTQAALKRS